LKVGAGVALALGEEPALGETIGTELALGEEPAPSGELPLGSVETRWIVGTRSEGGGGGTDEDELLMRLPGGNEAVAAGGIEELRTGSGGMIERSEAGPSRNRSLSW
jgi:hypothetical protein